MASPPGHVSKRAIADIRRAIDDGEEARLGLRTIPRLLCEAATPAKHYRPEGGRCPYAARFTTRTGKQLCSQHAALWAASALPV